MESMELNPCPFCGSENISITVPSNHGGWDGPPGYIVRCKKCFAEIDLQCSSKKDTLIKWNSRYEPPNPPLTLDELREMDGEPIFLETGLVSLREQLIAQWEILTEHDKNWFFFTRRLRGFHAKDYGVTWLAYRRRPEEGNNETD